MVGYILLEDFQRRNPDLEMKVHSDKLHHTGIGPVSIYYPPGEDGYTKIDEHLVKTSPNGTKWISTLLLWSGDGTGQEEVLRVTGPRTAEFTSYRHEDGQGRFIFPVDGDTRTLPESWSVPLVEGRFYWLYTTYSCGIDNLVVLQDGYLFTVQVRQDDVILYPRPSRHWFWTGSISGEGDVEYSLSAFEYSEEQYQDLDLENYPETIVPDVLADVTYLIGGIEFRGFVSARNSELACLLVQEYLDSSSPILLQEYIYSPQSNEWDEDRYQPEEVQDWEDPWVAPWGEADMTHREEDQGWDQYQPEEIQDQGQDMTHWEDNLPQKEKVKEGWWKFYHACRRLKNRVRDAYLDWRYGKPIPLPDHHGRKKYRPGQPDKILHPSRR